MFALARPGQFAADRDSELVQIPHGASAGTARVATTAARATRRQGCAGGAFRRNGEDGQLRLQFFAVALGALGLVFAEDQRLELVLTLLANVFKNRHELLPDLRQTQAAII